MVALFAGICEERFNLRIDDIRTGYPDCIAVKRNGQRVRIEFEFESSRFNHDEIEECDWVVCWVDNAKQNEEWRDYLKVVELAPEFPEVGADVWIQPYTPENVARFAKGKVFDEWTVPSRARKGDLLLIYRSGHAAAITHVMELGTTAEYDHEHGWGTGYTARLRKVFTLPNAVPRAALLNDDALKESYFVNPNPLGRSVLGSWPEIRRVLLEHNPRAGLVKALAPYATKPERVAGRSGRG